MPNPILIFPQSSHILGLSYILFFAATPTCPHGFYLKTAYIKKHHLSHMPNPILIFPQSSHILGLSYILFFAATPTCPHGFYLKTAYKIKQHIIIAISQLY